MGDRVVITFTNEAGHYSPGVYLHWDGRCAKGWIQEAVPVLRRGDPSYSAARFCGECHVRLSGVLGLGLLDAPDVIEPGFHWNLYSHGDAGVYVVNVDTGQVAAHGGYGRSFSLDPAEFGHA